MIMICILKISLFIVSNISMLVVSLYNEIKTSKELKINKNTEESKALIYHQKDKISCM